MTAEESGDLVVATERPGEISRVLGEAGVWLTALGPVGGDLESIFLSLTEHDRLGGGAP